MELKKFCVGKAGFCKHTKS